MNNVVLLLATLLTIYSDVLTVSNLKGPKRNKRMLLALASSQAVFHSCYCGFQRLDTQTRRKDQFCIVLTLSPRLRAFRKKEYLTADSSAITGIVLSIVTNKCIWCKTASILSEATASALKIAT